MKHIIPVLTCLECKYLTPFFTYEEDTSHIEFITVPIIATEKYNDYVMMGTVTKCYIRYDFSSTLPSYSRGCCYNSPPKEEAKLSDFLHLLFKQKYSLRRYNNPTYSTLFPRKRQGINNDAPTLTPIPATVPIPAFAVRNIIDEVVEELPITEITTYGMEQDRTHNFNPNVTMATTRTERAMGVPVVEPNHIEDTERYITLNHITQDTMARTATEIKSTEDIERQTLETDRQKSEHLLEVLRRTSESTNRPLDFPNRPYGFPNHYTLPTWLHGSDKDSEDKDGE